MKLNFTQVDERSADFLANFSLSQCLFLSQFLYTSKNISVQWDEWKWRCDEWKSLTIFYASMVLSLCVSIQLVFKFTLVKMTREKFAENLNEEIISQGFILAHNRPRPQISVKTQCLKTRINDYFIHGFLLRFSHKHEPIIAKLAKIHIVVFQWRT